MVCRSRWPKTYSHHVFFEAQNTFALWACTSKAFEGMHTAAKEGDGLRVRLHTDVHLLELRVQPRELAPERAEIRHHRLEHEDGEEDVAPDRRGEPGVRSHCRFAPPPIHFIPDSRTYSVPQFLKRQCDRSRGEPPAEQVGDADGEPAELRERPEQADGELVEGVEQDPVDCRW